MTTIFKEPNDLLDEIGQQLDYSDWLTVTQDRINKFADATGDHQWIHVDPKRAKDGPFGTCIAHGYLTLSLVNFFLRTRNRVGLITYGESVNVISPDTGERHLFKILTALAEIKSAGSLGLHTVLGDLRNFTPRSPVMVISTLENEASLLSKFISELEISLFSAFINCTLIPIL